MKKILALILLLPLMAAAQSPTTETEYNFVKDSCKSLMNGYSLGEAHTYDIEVGGAPMAVTFKELLRKSDQSICALVMIYQPPHPGLIIPPPTYFCIPSAGSPMWSQFNQDLQTFGETYWGAMIGIGTAMSRYISDARMPQKK
ncbi:MAG TPA: hypothetical protein VE978_03305 [Chitinophagales bacterium]|nr:hypothetical protein [Chitinophagales bacterium]